MGQKNIIRIYCIDNEPTDYRVSKQGKIYSTKRGKLREMSPVITRHGYLNCHIRHKGKSFYKYVHRMVAETFIDNPDNLPQVNHINGNKLDNSVDNLEWVTAKENVEHAFKTKLRNFGEKSSNAKITGEKVHEICKLLEENTKTMREISELTGVPYHLIFFIRKKKTWPEITSQYNFDHYNCFSKNRGYSKLTEDDVENICKDLLSGDLTGREIAQKYNVHENTIYDLKAAKRWKDITTKYFQTK